MVLVLESEGWTMPLLKRKRILEGKHVEQPVVDYALKTYGIKSLKLNTRGWSSWPDRVFFFPKPWLLFVEFKRPGEEPTENQRDLHIYLEGLGYGVYVIDNKEEGCKLIDLQARLARVASTRLPKESNEVRNRAKRGGPVPRPRSR